MPRKQIPLRNYALGLLVAIPTDAADYLLAPAFDLPLIGDIADGITTIIFYKLFGKVGLLDAIEFIPGFDLLPTGIATVAAAFLKDRVLKI